MKYVFLSFVGFIAIAFFAYFNKTVEPTVVEETLGAGVLTRELRANEITNIQNKLEEIKATTGKYPQVTTDGRILIINGEISELSLKTLLPSNVSINTYETENGEGIQIVQVLSDRIMYYGVGADAERFTYSHSTTYPLLNTQ